MPVIVGLDLSLNGTGVCVVSGETAAEVVHSSLLKRETVPGVQAQVARLISISVDIIDIINKFKPNEVIIEAAARSQVWQAAAIGEVHGVVKADIVRQTGIIPRVEQASKMRKEVVGTINSKRVTYYDTKGKKKSRVNYGLLPSKIKGKSKRATIKDVIEQRLLEQGAQFSTQDEMDAYVAAKFGWITLKLK